MSSKNLKVLKNMTDLDFKQNKKPTFTKIQNSSIIHDQPKDAKKDNPVDN